MKNTAVTEFLFALATLAISATLFIGCGGDPACENGTCDQGPDDAGTNGDGDPITGKDGGTDGDVASGDAGSDDPHACDQLDSKKGVWYVQEASWIGGREMTISLSLTGKECSVSSDGEGAAFKGEGIFTGSALPLERSFPDGTKHFLKEDGEGIALEKKSPDENLTYHYRRTEP